MRISPRLNPSGLYALAFTSSKEDVSEEVRSFLIETHLNSQELFLFIPRSFEKRSLKRWEWTNLSFKEMEWKSIFFVAAKVALYVSIFLLGIAKGVQLFRNATSNDEIRLAVALIGVLLAAAIRQLHIFLKRQQQGPYLHTILLEKVGASLAGVDTSTLANNIQEGQILDPIWFDELPRSPKTLVVGVYAMLAKDALEATLTRRASYAGEIPHPIEQRSLNDQEKERLLNDLSYLLCTPKEEILSCWGGRQIGGARGPLVYPSYRQNKFISLLPKPILDKYFPRLSSPQEVVEPQTLEEQLAALNQQANALLRGLRRNLPQFP